MGVHFRFDFILKETKLLGPRRVFHPQKQRPFFEGARQRLRADGCTDNLWPLLLKAPPDKPVGELRLAILQEPL